MSAGIAALRVEINSCIRHLEAQLLGDSMEQEGESGDASSVCAVPAAQLQQCRAETDTSIASALMPNRI